MQYLTNVDYIDSAFIPHDFKFSRRRLSMNWVANPKWHLGRTFVGFFESVLLFFIPLKRSIAPYYTRSLQVKGLTSLLWCSHYVIQMVNRSYYRVRYSTKHKLVCLHVW